MYPAYGSKDENSKREKQVISLVISNREKHKVKPNERKAKSEGRQ